MKKLLAVAALAACAAGCVMPQAPISAGITIDVQGPMSYVDNSVKPEKVGVATAKGILVYADGDASISAAMKNGGIKKVHHIDTKSRNILGIVGEYTTIVYGE